ncbi:MAG: bifunctional phosphoribosyl-AMP cyclohydrolase/phosphoribosyl-ATP diphosphatase HisIE [Candidatus Tectomicrobia bacterium]|uniref:Histidine biosynthesis bifunctional protein HisIE n=1 Tax=Tectimicrobiota bacterium TaxID=2528274 RepID=A0A937W214_UNCTE|nr:bifunctional phosphoribosyl-AMP cyclohydrolase/phosphoribosyl-ATP diphosphatase HisIE [Candidatus Tectomicrobia bacterium]
MIPVPEALRFGPDGLLPAIIQDATDGTVLMLAYMNAEALELTRSTGYTHFWSRSRQALWKKGETSGHVQRVMAMAYDCDGDTLLVQVQQQNVACHTGQRSCFYRALPLSEEEVALPTGGESPAPTAMLDALYQLILTRRDSGADTSYVKKLFQRGQDVMCKKVAEEAAEVLIASKNGTAADIIYEMADLWFHALVLLGHHTIHPHEILHELQRRFGQPGGGKPVQASHE